MKTTSRNMTMMTLAGALYFFLMTTAAQAQFSKPVVLLKGTVQAEKTGAAHSVRVSIRSVDQRDREITGSEANSETGKYLVVLKPATTYVVHLEGDDILTKDVTIQTPACSSTEDMVKNFTVTTVTVSSKSSLSENK